MRSFIFVVLVMSVDYVDKQWGCGKPGANLHRMGSMVCEMGDPCLHQSPIKVVLAEDTSLKCCYFDPLLVALTSPK